MNKGGDMEKHTDTISIEHDEHGRVEGVKRDSFGADWGRNGACYFACDGWREVKPKKWVLYAKQELKDNIRWKHLGVWFEEHETVTKFTLPEGYRWRAVEIEREVEG